MPIVNGKSISNQMQIYMYVIQIYTLHCNNMANDREKKYSNRIQEEYNPCQQYDWMVNPN